MPRTPPARPDDRARLQLCLAASALEFGADGLDLHTPGARGPVHDFARQVAMRLAHTAFGMSYARIAQLVQRHASTVSHGCRVVERECENPVFAERIDRLEAGLQWLTHDHARSLLSGSTGGLQ